MKYRVKHHDNTLIKFLFPVHFMGIEFDTYSVQCKQHWWSRWKICYNTDDIADAYNSLMKYQTNNKQSLPLGRYFTHNRDKNKQVWCDLCVGKLSNHDKDYNDGMHYYAGYKPKRYHNYYHCSYGKSYEQAIYKLYWDLYVKEELLNLKM